MDFLQTPCLFSRYTRGTVPHATLRPSPLPGPEYEIVGKTSDNNMIVIGHDNSWRYGFRRTRYGTLRQRDR